MIVKDKINTINITIKPITIKLVTKMDTPKKIMIETCLKVSKAMVEKTLMVEINSKLEDNMDTITTILSQMYKAQIKLIIKPHLKVLEINTDNKTEILM